jgi:hypothetical protein
VSVGVGEAVWAAAGTLTERASASPTTGLR